MSRNLNIASALLFVIGIVGVFAGLQTLFLPSSYMTEEFLGMTVSELHSFNPNVVDWIEHTVQTDGLHLLVVALAICVIVLIPYRRGEKWAWYAMLVIGGVLLFPQLILFVSFYSGKTQVFIYLDIILIILWIAGLALPAKEILG